jgi:hypothetical protein
MKREIEGGLSRSESVDKILRIIQGYSGYVFCASNGDLAVGKIPVPDLAKMSILS